MNHELSTTAVITNTTTNQQETDKNTVNQSSDCNRNESGTKRKRGRPKSPMAKKPWTLPVSKAFYEKMRRRGEMIMDALGYGALWMKYLMPHLDTYMLKGEKLGYHYEYECMRIVFTCLCLDIDTAMERSARAKARAAERRAAAEMAKAEIAKVENEAEMAKAGNEAVIAKADEADEEAIKKSAEKVLEKHEADKATGISIHPDGTTQPVAKTESNHGERPTESKANEPATNSATPETNISQPISGGYNPDDTDRLSMHNARRFFRKNAMKIKRTQVRRV